MWVVLLMLIYGSALFIFFTLIFKKTTIFCEKYKSLISKMTFNLLFIPIPIIIFLTCENFNIKNPKCENYKIYHFYEKIIMVFNGKTYITKALLIELSFMLFWFFIFFIIVIVEIKKQKNFEKILKLDSYKVNDYETMQILSECKKNLKIKRNIAIYQYYKDISPCTIGTIKPIIILPYISDKTKKKIIIYHELCHIKNNDSVFLLIMRVSKIIYKFFPFIKSFCKELRNRCEYACDEQVTQFLSKNEKIIYSELIIDMANKRNNAHKIFNISSNKDEEVIKNRIDIIMRDNKKNKSYKKMALVTISLIAIVTLPAFTYNYPKVLVMNGSQEEMNKIRHEIMNGSVEFFYKSEEKKDYNKSTIIYKNGFVHDISKNSQKNKNCKKHSYIIIDVQKHGQNSKADYKTYIYEDEKKFKICDR